MKVQHLLYSVLLGGLLPVLSYASAREAPELQTSGLIGVYEREGSNVWSYDYATVPSAIPVFDKYFTLLTEGQLSKEQIERTKYEAFKGNTCKLWNGNWLVSTTTLFPNGKGIAAPKPHVGYSPRTGWSLQLPMLQPVPITVSQFVLNVPLSFMPDGQLPLGNVTLQWLADGKVVETRSISPTVADAQGNDNKTVVGKTFKLPDQQFQVEREANYRVRVLGAIKAQPVAAQGQGAMPNRTFEASDAIMKLNQCSAVQAQR